MTLKCFLTTQEDYIEKLKPAIEKFGELVNMPDSEIFHGIEVYNIIIDGVTLLYDGKNVITMGGVNLNINDTVSRLEEVIGDKLKKI